jgi:hypothetical protein
VEIKVTMELQDCPHCGSPVESSSICCKACGSDVETGWGDPAEIDYQSIALPEEDSNPVAPLKMVRNRRRRIGLALLGGLMVSMYWYGIFQPIEALLVWLVIGLFLRMVQQEG